MINHKKILCLAGSPRKGGNSQYCARMIIRFLENHPNFDTEFVRLVDYEIKRCMGCRACIEKGHCVIKDDFEMVWHRLLESDIVVIGVPVFWDSPPGIMKDFMDQSHGHFIKLRHATSFPIMQAVDL